MTKEENKVRAAVWDLKHWNLFRISGFGFRISAILLAVGCSHNQPTSRPVGAYERQEAALRDPFGYSPEMGKANISGGDLKTLDKKAMKKDIDHVLNP